MGKPVEMDDGALLRRFQSGDAAALDALLERYETSLFHFLLGILRDRHQAEDVLQETWCRALEKLDGVDATHFKGWLYTVAYHEAMLHKRKAKRRSTGPIVADVADLAPGAEALIQEREDAQKLRTMIDQLPHQQRSVLLQRIYEGKRFREIADEEGCPLNTALARMHDGLKKLKLMWGEEHA